MIFKNQSLKTISVLLLLFFATYITATAQNTTAAAPSAADAFQLVRYVMLTIAVLLLIVIAVLGKGINAAGGLYLDKLMNSPKNKVPFILLPLIASSTLLNAANIQGVLLFSTAGIPSDIYWLGSFIFLEFIVVLVLFNLMYKLMSNATAENKEAAAIAKKKVPTIFQKLNETVAIEEEDSLDLMHNYDGIRELDNKVPSWWAFAFYAGIVFAGVYLYRTFVTETIPSQYVELAKANEVAEEQKLVYLSKAANNVDENKIVMADEAGIAQGAILYAKNCVACHGDKGQGGVGPNLVDNYWVHKGSLEGIFYSIKYGWPEKGMISWKENFSPAQMVQLTSYVKTLVGTKPEGAKEPQGELYLEENNIDAALPDSLTRDSTGTVATK